MWVFANYVRDTATFLLFICCWTMHLICHQNLFRVGYRSKCLCLCVLVYVYTAWVLTSCAHMFGRERCPQFSFLTFSSIHCLGSKDPCYLVTKCSLMLCLCGWMPPPNKHTLPSALCAKDLSSDILRVDSQTLAVDREQSDTTVSS